VHDANIVEAVNGKNDIDIGTDTIQANVKSLSPDTQAIWDTISNKTIIY
jgi:hypothetical protein